MSTDGFDSAEYYDCRDGTLWASTPEEAVQEWIECEMKPGRGVREAIQECGECEITAYRHLVVTEEWIEAEAKSLLERAADSFGESFSNPGGSEDDFLNQSDLAACLPAMMEAVRQLTARGTVWSCEPVGTRVLDADEVEAMMREYNPEWFEAPDSPAVASLETAQVGS